MEHKFTLRTCDILPEMDRRESRSDALNEVLCIDKQLALLWTDVVLKSKDAEHDYVLVTAVLKDQVENEGELLQLDKQFIETMIAAKYGEYIEQRGISVAE